MKYAIKSNAGANGGTCKSNAGRIALVARRAGLGLVLASALCVSAAPAIALAGEATAGVGIAAESAAVDAAADNAVLSDVLNDATTVDAAPIEGASIEGASTGAENPVSSQPADALDGGSDTLDASAELQEGATAGETVAETPTGDADETPAEVIDADAASVPANVQDAPAQTTPDVSAPSEPAQPTTKAAQPTTKAAAKKDEASAPTPVAEASVCAGASSAVADKMNIYRLYSPRSDEHLYTSNYYEAMTIASTQGWQWEGIGFTASATVGTPVYRLYSPASGLHLWTTDAYEKQVLSSAARGWNYEGIAWYGVGNIHMWRLYNPKSGQHLYTRDANEVSVLTMQWGWTEESSAGTWEIGGTHDYVPIKATRLVSSAWGNGQQRYWIQGNGSIAKNKTIAVDGVEYVADSTGAVTPKSEYDFVDTWASRINAYMAGYPLAGQGRNFAQAAFEYGLDPRLSPALASLESTRGKYCFRAYNAWGWTGRSFSNWGEAIAAHVRYLATSGYYGFTWGPYGKKFSERDAQTYSGGYYGAAYLERFMRGIWA